MKPPKTTLLLLLTIFNLSISFAQQGSKSLSADFKLLIGAWKGSLTYLDYTSGKPYTMPADLEVKQLGEGLQFSFFNIYPDEASANGMDTITLSSDGKYIDQELIKSRKLLEDGTIVIITEQRGQDGNDHKSATFRFTYMISNTKFSKKKEVQFDGESTWIKRHEYGYGRK